MKCCTFVTALSVFKMWPGEVLCCLLFQTFRFLVLGTDQAASAVELAILTLSYTSIFTISKEGRSRHLGTY